MDDSKAMTKDGAQSATASADSDVSAGLRATKRGATRVITFDRPAARNALDVAATATLTDAMPGIARDADTYAIVMRSSRPGTFCAGGDVRELARLVAADLAAARKALAAEYRLIWLMECLSKPVTSLIDGGVMGAGAGITLVNTHRVAAEGYWFAMPEVRLGLFPDDGVAHALARLPGATGEYLALTGRRLQRADAYALGLVTHCIDRDRFEEIEQRLADATPIDPLLDGLHRPPGAGELAAWQGWIDDCFSAATVEEIRARLAARAAGGSDAGAWAAAALADLDLGSPLALKVALRHVRQSRALDLRQTLTIDYRLAARLVAAHDFREGVRAALVDRDHHPRWRPRTLAELSDALIDDLFKTSPDTWLSLPTRQEMQAARV